jgi:hypothetical protein
VQGGQKSLLHQANTTCIFNGFINFTKKLSKSPAFIKVFTKDREEKDKASGQKTADATTCGGFSRDVANLWQNAITL